MISPKFLPTVDMIEPISKKSPDGRIPARAPNAFIIYRKVYVETARENGCYLPMTIISSMASQSWESADETIKAEYRRIAKEALRVRNEMYSGSGRRKKKQSKSKCYPRKFNVGKNIQRNTLRLEHKEAMPFIHEIKILSEVSHPNIIKFYGVYKANYLRIYR
ncbi:hypothetical protein C2G38_2068957 [Gigaspora rosea]|uniref:HMG box domain-containing protein n=1 Tax=Gigaspora rosea TaxID=44941 RepID=A0A397W0J2_9GLOM|nr:hypothetical protein C2G38_2068957 [Gigaspora rosea]